MEVEKNIEICQQRADPELFAEAESWDNWSADTDKSGYFAIRDKWIQQ